MALTFRRAKIEDYLHRLWVRKAVLKNQLEQEEFKSLEQYIKGEIKALDLIIKELADEFNINYPERDRSTYPNLEDVADGGDIIREEDAR